MQFSNAWLQVPPVPTAYVPFASPPVNGRGPPIDSFSVISVSLEANVFMILSLLPVNPLSLNPDYILPKGSWAQLDGLLDHFEELSSPGVHALSISARNTT